MSERYTSWSLERLNKEKAKIEKAIESVEQREKKAAIAQITALARQKGFDLDQLISESLAVKKSSVKSRKTKGGKVSAARTVNKVPPKYMNPDDESQTWTGRGRKPSWFVTKLAEGYEREDLQIATESA